MCPYGRARTTSPSCATGSATPARTTTPAPWRSASCRSEVEPDTDPRAVGAGRGRDVVADVLHDGQAPAPHGVGRRHAPAEWSGRPVILDITDNSPGLRPDADTP